MVYEDELSLYVESLSVHDNDSSAEST
jgi:hypothetical protein